ncbi:hypothetical protein L2E82_40691 [Cichorium intybus]|uniref:Uncharacterized protein n=1 Tax=Cichorium intybus TaxID=13427 RepID=A0ACB9AMN3_CICIN|nr:hypothetical protein L2E82_40691 [Cichorium intybus]
MEALYSKRYEKYTKLKANKGSEMKKDYKKNGDTLESIGIDSEREIYHTLAFLAGDMIWSQLTDLPFSLYSTFVIEERHGFNKQIILLYIRDMTKCMFLAAVIGPPCQNKEEVLAVIAHELGDWKLNDTMYSFITVQGDSSRFRHLSQLDSLIHKDNGKYESLGQWNLYLSFECPCH